MFDVVLLEIATQKFECLFRSVRPVDQAQVFRRNGSGVHQCLEIDDLVRSECSMWCSSRSPRRNSNASSGVFAQWIRLRSFAEMVPASTSAWKLMILSQYSRP